jgi:3-keto-L-gulonate-6-phosphate decarboxylase
MSSRKQLAKLKSDLGLAATDADVKAISQLMDELAAAAAGGLNPDRMTLADYFEPQPQPKTNPE